MKISPHRTKYLVTELLSIVKMVIYQSEEVLEYPVYRRLTYLLGDCRNKVGAYCITGRQTHYSLSNVAFEPRSRFVHDV